MRLLVPPSFLRPPTSSSPQTPTPIITFYITSSAILPASPFVSRPFPTSCSDFLFQTKPCQTKPTDGPVSLQSRDQRIVRPHSAPISSLPSLTRIPIITKRQLLFPSLVLSSLLLLHASFLCTLPSWTSLSFSSSHSILFHLPSTLYVHTTNVAHALFSPLTVSLFPVLPFPFSLLNDCIG
jgi:hypothetical protein